MLLLGPWEQGGGEFGIVLDALEHAFHEEEFAFGVELVEAAPGFCGAGEGFAFGAVGCGCLGFFEGGLDAFCVHAAAEDGFFCCCYHGWRLEVGFLLLRWSVFGICVEDAVLWRHVA